MVTVRVTDRDGEEGARHSTDDADGPAVRPPVTSTRARCTSWATALRSSSSPKGNRLERTGHTRRRPAHRQTHSAPITAAITAATPVTRPHNHSANRVAWSKDLLAHTRTVVTERQSNSVIVHSSHSTNGSPNNTRYHRRNTFTAASTSGAHHSILPPVHNDGEGDAVGDQEKSQASLEASRHDLPFKPASRSAPCPDAPAHLLAQGHGERGLRRDDKLKYVLVGGPNGATTTVKV